MKESPLSGIAQLLVEHKLLDKESAAFYQQDAINHNMGLPQYLVVNHIIPPDIIASSIAKHFGLPFFDLDNIELTSIPSTLMNEDLIQRHRVVPLFHQGNQLQVAMDDPSQYDACKDIQFYTGLHVVPLVVETHKLNRLINQLLHQHENQDLADLIDESPIDDLAEKSCKDQPVVKFVKRIILDAVEQNVSDIHFEPYEQNYRVRYRQDGLLIAVASPPLTLSTRIAARIKIMSNMDISERRIPQDGRFRLRISHTKTIDFRVSTCPTVGGEKIVIRILDATSTKPEIDTLCFLPQQKSQFLHALSRAQGMILVTGPTGSGKTLTLYSALNILNTGEKNVSTVEDPVEINLHGINQVNVNPKSGLTFANTLRAFLRQDPDVLMIGEIRDLETAEIAVKAAQTGHLVLSTLHTNSAVETLTRLVSMGIPSFNIASSISLIIAQRLVRRLCNACKIIRNDLTPYNLTELGLSNTEDNILRSYTARGCIQCTDGYRGRIALFEVMPISTSIAEMIMTGKNSLKLLKQAQTEGMLTIFESGLERVRMGTTCLEEITRITAD